jgi:hypothetical protein
LDLVEYQTIHACLRPSRTAVAYQRRSDWIYSARQVIRTLSMGWGGAGAVIVPLDDHGTIADPLLPMLRVCDPDHVVVHALTIADLAVEQPDIVDRLVEKAGLQGEAPEETWARLSREQLHFAGSWDALAAQVDGWCCPFKGLQQEARTFDQMEVGILQRDDRDPSLAEARPGDVTYTLDMASVDPMMALMVESRVGALAADARRGRNVVELPVQDEDLPALVRLAITGEVDPGWDLHRRYLTATGVAMTAPPPNALPGDHYLARTPFARTCQWLAKVSIGWPPPARICVVGDTAEDHALAVLCDRVFDHGAWVPLSLLREDSGVGRAARRAVRRLPWLGRADHRPVLMVSASQTLDQVTGLVTDIEDLLGVDIDGTPTEQQRLRAAPLSELAEQPGRAFLADERSFDLRRFVPVRQADAELSLLTPVPQLPLPAAAEQLGDDVAWLVDVAVPSHQPPARTAISSATLLHRSAAAFPEAVVRASRDGVSFSSRNMGFVPGGASVEGRLAQPLLRLPSAERIFAELAAKHDARVQRSEAGHRSATATGLWGSPTAIAADLTGDVRRLLDAFIPPPSTRGDYGDGYAIRGDGFLTVRHAAQVLGADEHQARDVLDRLLAIKVLRRGLLLYCERCRTQAFYPIGAVGEDGFACLICGYPSLLARGRWYEKEAEPAWNYALDQVVRNLLKMHGDIPLLAATRLASGKRSSPLGAGTVDRAARWQHRGAGLVRDPRRRDRDRRGEIQ